MLEAPKHGVKIVDARLFSSWTPEPGNETEYTLRGKDMISCDNVEVSYYQDLGADTS